MWKLAEPPVTLQLLPSVSSKLPIGPRWSNVTPMQPGVSVPPAKPSAAQLKTAT